MSVVFCIIINVPTIFCKVSCVTRNMSAILLGIFCIKSLLVLSIVFYVIRNVPVILSIVHLVSQKLMLTIKSEVFCFTRNLLRILSGVFCNWVPPVTKYT